MYDIQELKRTIDIKDFASRFTDLKEKVKNREWAGPCPICNGVDRFFIKYPPDKPSFWMCRKCEKSGDVIALAGLIWGLNTKADFIELCQRLQAPEIYCSVRPNNKNNTIPAPVDDSPPSQEWQARAGAVINTCSKWLWESTGDKARAYLEARGLDEFAIAHFKLGFCPADQTIEGHFVHKGILIPHLAGGHLWGVKIRRASNKPGEKYRSIEGSKQNLFNADSLAKKQAAFVVEGEFDAMLLHWEICDLAAVVTLGSASGTLGSRWLPAMLPVKRFYIATDNDQAGQDAAAKWLKLVGSRGRSVTIPQGKDITDYHQAGEDLRGWAMSHLNLKWVDSDVAAIVRAADRWPVTLYADSGSRPVTFENENDLRAATC